MLSQWHFPLPARGSAASPVIDTEVVVIPQRGGRPLPALTTRPVAIDLTQPQLVARKTLFKPYRGLATGRRRQLGHGFAGSKSPVCLGASSRSRLIRTTPRGSRPSLSVPMRPRYGQHLTVRGIYPYSKASPPIVEEGRLGVTQRELRVLE